MPELIHCERCGYDGRVKKLHRGSVAVAILLWLFFLVPGLIYTVWMFAAAERRCPKCLQPNPVPLDVYRTRMEPKRAARHFGAPETANTPITPTEK